MDNAEKKPELQKEVSDKYDLVGIPVGTFQVNGFGTIDMTKVDLAHADALVKRKFPHLREKKKSAAIAKEVKAPDVVKAGAEAAAK